jgi:hypothetical protein
MGGTVFVGRGFNPEKTQPQGMGLQPLKYDSAF